MPRGQKPKADASPRAVAARTHEVRHAEGRGWQHGRKPNPPAGLTDVGKRAWRTWLGSWWAFFYTPDDLPGLELTVDLYDRVRRGDLDPSKVTPLLDRYGITPKGRQDLRWAPQLPGAGSKKAAPAGPATTDEVEARRQKRAARLG